MVEIKKCSNSTPRSHDISPDGKTITFRPCNYKSTSIIDIETKYCKLCQMFIEQEVHDPLTDPELRE